MKTKKLAAIAFAILATFGTNAMANDNVKYEFETFSGKNVSICNTNICYQQSVENVLESQVVPADAEVIAPGRDFVYLENANYYFVQDAAHSLLTVARKNMYTETAILGNAFMLSYMSPSFTKFVDSKSVILSYTRKDIQAAGSNFAMFSMVDEPSSKTYLERKVTEMGGAKENIIATSMSGVKGMAYTYQTISESKESGLKVVSVLYAVPCGQKTVEIEVVRTVGPDDGTEYAIDADFEHLFQSFLTLK